MIEIEKWLKNFTETIQRTFGDRIVCTGIQGSYGRGEATEQSDIDVVVILDKLTPDDIRQYDAAISKLPNRQLICGFLSGKEELLHWESSDLFQFYFDTTPLVRDLEPLRTLLTKEAVARAIQIGAGNIYHGCVHNMLHEKSREVLKDLYKASAITAQAVYYQKTGEYVKQKNALMERADMPEREILKNYMRLRSDDTEWDFAELSETLFLWAQRLLGGEA